MTEINSYVDILRLQREAQRLRSEQAAKMFASLFATIRSFFTRPQRRQSV